MNTVELLFLLTLADLMQLDILFWVLSLVLVALLTLHLLWQRRQHKNLVAELAMLETVERRTIEYDLVLKAMKLAIWHIDVKKRTITYDSDYRDVLDIPTIPPGADVELFCNILVAEDKERIKARMKDLMEGRVDLVHEQYRTLSPLDNSITWGETHAVIDRRDAEGHPLTIVGTSMRIDKQKEIEAALIEARNKAEESDRLKTAFLANISHEVRTPLNAIVGFSEVLATGQLSAEECTQLHGLIRQNNVRLLHLFEDMVNMSRLDAGGETLTMTCFSINNLLQELVKKYAPEAAEKNLSLETSHQGEDVELRTDRNCLTQILSHYIDNALKFTDKGCVSVGFNLQIGNVRLWVRDTGRGIEPEFCGDKIFERFVKVDEFEQGTGLGLSICRSLALKLGGKVGMESEVGHGSLFWVDVPYK